MADFGIFLQKMSETVKKSLRSLKKYVLKIWEGQLSTLGR